MIEAAHSPVEGRYHLRLFVAGGSQRSLRTIVNLRRICERHLAGRNDLEIIDIYQQPGLAAGEEIVAAPTLAKLSPAPRRQIVGDLSDVPRVLRALGIRLVAGSLGR